MNQSETPEPTIEMSTTDLSLESLSSEKERLLARLHQLAHEMSKERAAQLEDPQAEKADPGDEIVVTTSVGEGRVDVCPAAGRRSDFTMSWDAWGVCARSGCPACILRRKIVLDSGYTMSQDSQDLPALVLYDHDLLFDSFEFDKKLFEWIVEKSDLVEECEIYDRQVKFGGTGTYGPDLGRMLRPCDPSFGANLPMALDWINECDNEHPCITDKLPPLPKRLLDLRDGRVRLARTEGERGHYACLSHRWGSTLMLQTNAVTMKKFEQDIPWLTIPQTFQDAITFTRGLGLDYLWIDCVCIVQDDAVDWQEQSGAMAQIYSNSYITLAAAVAEDSNSRCLSHGDRRCNFEKMPVELTVNGVEIPVFGRQALEHGSFPLLKRGWVHQERLLSPRIIYFASEELLWECLEKEDCECQGHHGWQPRAKIPRESAADGPNDDSSDETSDSSSDGSSDGSSDPFSDMMDPKDPHEMWRVIVTDYSTLDLTFPKDCLPALSGIAQVFGKAMEDEYVAGLWKKFLISDLLWFRSLEEAEMVAAHWRAPSWSWASTESIDEVQFHEVERPLAELVETVVEPAGRDPYGELTSAHIRIRAKGICANIQRDPTSPTGYTVTFRSGDDTPLRLNHHVCPLFSLRTTKIKAEALQQVIVVPIGRKITSYGVAMHSIPEHGLKITYTYPDEALSCLVISKDKTGEERWQRIGLLHLGKFPFRNKEDCPATEVYMPRVYLKLQRQHGMSDKEIQSRYEEGFEAQEAIFRAFDEESMQEYTLW